MNTHNNRNNNNNNTNSNTTPNDGNNNINNNYYYNQNQNRIATTRLPTTTITMGDIPEEVLVEILEYVFFWGYIPVEEKLRKFYHSADLQKQNLFLALALVSKQWKGIIRRVILSIVLSYQ